jgi:ribosomal protein S27E
MSGSTEKTSDECIMKCPDCSHQMNVCKSRIRSAKDPVCPGCGAILVPITKSEKIQREPK